jgi:hypothetical protein
MIRHCDGRDPGLVSPHGVRCNCGLTFDDEARKVIFPHDRIGSVEDLVRESHRKDQADEPR